MDTAALKFFHGTCGQAAAAILADGARDPFTPLRAREFVREVWPVILGAAGSFEKTANLFVEAGSRYHIGAPIALQNVYNDYAASTFAYGAFYVTLGLEKAARYAMRGRSGSELLLFVEEAVKVVRILDQGLIDRLASQYSELMSQLERPLHPVVLEVSGIEASRLSGEAGEKPKPGFIELLIELRGDNQFDPSFRITNVTKSDITAVYDLNALVTDWERNLWGNKKHSLPLGILENCRMTLSDWISTKAGPTETAHSSPR